MDEEVKRWTAKRKSPLVRSYGLKQEFITPHCPQQNGMVERVIRTLKEQCTHRQRFEILQHASRVIGDWIQFHNNKRPRQALRMQTPAATFALATQVEKISLGHYIGALGGIAPGIQSRCSSQTRLIDPKGNMDKTFSPHKFLDGLAEELIFNFARASGGTTPGLVGSAREHEVRNKLQSVLPTKVAVATGCVIDSFGNTSNQCDVILYEKDHCPVFSINGDPASTYIPCESVIAVGEIKSSLGTSEINDAVHKIAKVKSLRRYFNDSTCFRSYGSVMSLQGIPSEAFDPEHKPFDQIYGFILCHEWSLIPATLANRYATACGRHPAHLSPNLLVSLKDGLMLFTDEQRHVLENRINAKHIFLGKTPDGEVPFLINKLASVANKGRTTEVLPYARYLLKSGNAAFSEGTFYPAASA